MNFHLSPKRFAGLALLPALPILVPAQNWSNPDGADWNVASNWDTNAVPTSAQTGSLGIAVTGGIITNTNANQAIAGLYYTDKTGDSLTVQSTGSGSFLFGNGGSIRNNSTTIAGSFTVGGPILMAGSLSIYSNQVAGGTFTISGDISTTSANAVTLNLRGNNNNGAANNVITGLISDGTAGGTVSVTKFTSGGASWTLANNGNTFSGPVSIGSGSIYTATIGMTGSASALGTNGTINLGNATYGGTLVYNGVGETSNKVLNMAGSSGSAVIYSSGTGALNFTSDIAVTGAGPKILGLDGNNNTSYSNTLSGKISDSSGGTTSVTKGDGNIWVLSGANTYTGLTTINNGFLVFAKTSSLYNGNSASWTPTNIIFGMGKNTTDTGGTLALGVGDSSSGYWDSTAIGTLLDTSHLGQGFGAVTNVHFGFDTTNASNGSFTYGNVLADLAGASIGYSKLGTGTLILSAANTNTGTTQVLAGTLQVDGSLGTGAVTVTRGTLTGSGTINGAVTVASTATLAGSGTYAAATTISAGGFLNPSSLLTFNSDLTLKGQTTFDVAGAARGATYDAIDVGGTVTYGGALQIAFANLLPNGAVLQLFTGLDGTSAALTSGSFTSVDLSGAYAASLTLDSGVWTALGVNGLDFTFTEATGILSISTGAVPEPSTWALLAAGLATIGLAARRRRRA